MDATLPVYTISVRRLVEFLLRSGDLGVSGRFVGTNRGVEGTRGHQRLRKLRPASYLPEVTVEFRVPGRGVELKILGRIDGVLPDASPPWIEEVKTTEEPWSGPPHPLHVAQRDCYAAIYSIQQNLPEVDAVLTYFDLDTGLPTEFRDRRSRVELENFLQRLTEEFLNWAEWQQTWLGQRNSAAAELAFPFPFREGQRKLAVGVYRALRNGERLFAEAPTGTGKTMSVLFPALKVMADKQVERIFFLTARTAGAHSAQFAADVLQKQGAQLRVISLTARDKVCFCRKPESGITPETCPYANGYFDRVKTAVRELVDRGTVDAAAIREAALKHTVCPFELSLDASLWCDLIIGDYNYAFDPSSSLKRFFGEGKQNAILLVDEAHNLIDRGREMFSSELRQDHLQEVAAQLGKELRACRAVLKSAVKVLADSIESQTIPFTLEVPPEEFVSKLRRFLSTAEEWLVLNKPSAFRDDLLGLFFDVHRFVRCAEEWKAGMRCIVDATGMRLFCTNPSEFLDATLSNVHATVFFSATLKPLPYYQALLSGRPDDPATEITSSFPAENLKVIVAQYLSMELKTRSAAVEQLAQLIAAAVAVKGGNYLVYFPSFQYLGEVLPLLQEKLKECKLIVQEPNMELSAREAFLAEYSAGALTVGLAVLGGVFGEAIDLVGDRLIGVIVVGVGLPQLSFERNLIRQNFDSLEGNGFEMAYVYPGMNRVLQAAGRVIRSEEDRGIVLLIDRRFRETRYRSLFPSWWSPVFCPSEPKVLDELISFWQAGGSE